VALVEWACVATWVGIANAAPPSPDTQAGAFAPQLGHERRTTVKDLAWSPDGTKVASLAIPSGVVKVWDATTGNLIRTLPGDSSSSECAPSLTWSEDGTLLVARLQSCLVRVWSTGDWTLRSPPSLRLPARTAFSRDGTRLATASCGEHNCGYAIWDLRAGRQQALIGSFKMPPDALAWSPDGVWLATCADSRVVLWEARTGLPLNLATDSCRDRALAWSPDGSTLAVGVNWPKRRVNLYHVQSGKLVGALPFPDRFLTGISFSRDGRTVAAWDFRNTVVQLWDVRRKKALRPLWPALLGPPQWSPDGSTLAGPSTGGTFAFLHVRNARAAYVPSGHLIVAGVSWRPDGKVLATGGSDGTVQLWDTRTGWLIRGLGGWAADAHRVSWSPDGCTLAAHSTDDTVQLWDLRTGNVSVLPAPSGERSPYRSAQSHWYLQWSPDAKVLFSTQAAGAVATWSPSGGAPPPYSAGALVIAYDRQGRLVATLDSGGALRVFDLASGGTVWTDWLEPRTSRRQVVWHPDGLRLASELSRLRCVMDECWGDPWLRVSDARRGRVEREWKTPNPAHELAWSADGRYVAGAWDAAVSAWFVASGEVRTAALLHYQDSATDVAWSPRAPVLAWHANDDPGVKLWDLPSDKRRSLVGHTRRVLAIAWRPDGGQLASSGQDETVRLWEPDSGRAVRVLTGLQRPVESITWSLDGRFLGTAGEFVRVHRAADGATLWFWLVRRDGSAPVGLVHDDRGRFVGDPAADEVKAPGMERSPRLLQDFFGKLPCRAPVVSSKP
jgi:WD40 repeat protein